jgi:RNA polymerase sigma factor (sigma-70 family)
MGSIDEDIIIQKVLDGDVQSFEEIVRRYNMMVYTLAYRVLKIREEAEELAQDVFLKIYQSLDKFNRKSKLSTWIYRITYNASINKYKSQKRKIDTLELDNIHDLSISDSSDSYDEVSINDKREIINNSISKLPETDRIIITLYYYEELPIKEVAEIVGMSTHNVKIKLFRSRQKLFTELKDKVGQEKIDYYEYSG